MSRIHSISPCRIRSIASRKSTISVLDDAIMRSVASASSTVRLLRFVLGRLWTTIRHRKHREASYCSMLSRQRSIESSSSEITRSYSPSRSSSISVRSCASIGLFLSLAFRRLQLSLSRVSFSIATTFSLKRRHMISSASLKSGTSQNTLCPTYFAPGCA